MNAENIKFMFQFAYQFRLIGVILCISLSSCIYYTPQIAPPVLVEKKGDLDAGIGAALFWTPGGFLNLEYAPTNGTFAQIYTSFYVNENFHSQVLLGGKLLSKQRLQLRLASGYSYGVVDLLNEQFLFSKKEFTSTTSGNYQMIFGKLFLNSQHKSGKRNFGFSILFGKLYPRFDITTMYYNESGFEEPTKNGVFTGHANVLEPTIYYQFNDSKDIGFTIFYSYSFLDESSIRRQLLNGARFPHYNEFGNFGIALNFRFSKKDKKR